MIINKKQSLYKKIDTFLPYFAYFYKKKMTGDLTNINVLACGGSKGIGFASAKKLAEKGANITLLSRNENDLKIALEALPIVNNLQKHDYISADVSDIVDFTTKIKSLIASKSNPYLILINNTGGPPAGPIHTAKNEEFISAFNNHLIANHTLVSLLLEGMKAHKFGRIVNIISTSVKQPLPNLGVSNTIRAAVANWAKTLANELAPFHITVNNVLPGATATGRLASIIETKSSKLQKEYKDVEEEMLAEIPMKRFGQPEEIANAVAFLASKEASYITGINLPVDGGRTGNL